MPLDTLTAISERQQILWLKSIFHNKHNPHTSKPTLLTSCMSSALVTRLTDTLGADVERALCAMPVTWGRDWWVARGDLFNRQMIQTAFCPPLTEKKRECLKAFV